MSIRIFITGGTFDKEYNELNGTLFLKTLIYPKCSSWAEAALMLISEH